MADKCVRVTGWLREYTDFQDYTPERDTVSDEQKARGQTASVQTMLQKLRVPKALREAPKAADLRRWCSPIEDQQSLGACTAHAGVGLVEYFERRAYGKHTDASRLFLYKATRNLLRWTGDSGAFLRSTMSALKLFGVPPEEYYPYEIAKFDEEPSAFCYAAAQSFQALTYYRLDPPDAAPKAVLDRIRAHLAAGLPSMFGFSVYNSYQQAAKSGEIPFPNKGEKVIGGHAVMAVGYDDDRVIKNAGPRSAETKGALLIRNSWGESWGDKGYGWLPYEYVLKGLADDWWSLLTCEWVDSDQFGA